jgi:hypothetical protein
MPLQAGVWQIHKYRPCPGLADGCHDCILISVIAKYLSLRRRLLERIRRSQIPLVQQVAGDFRQEARRLLHSIAAVLEL